MVKTYSRAAQGGEKVSQDFRVAEFACHDGSDTVLIDDELVGSLQAIRDALGKPCTITSGYRTDSYNRKVGGVSGSYHTKGMAADVTFAGVDPAEVAKCAETIGMRGIILYVTSRFCHLDVRPGHYYGKCVNGNTSSVDTFGGSRPPESYVLKRGCAGNAVAYLQQRLNYCRVRLALAFGAIAEDGGFGETTENAVKVFQAARNLTADGIVGQKTWSELDWSYADVDADAKVTTADAQIALQAAVGRIDLTDAQNHVADMDGDGKVTVSDAQQILKRSVGK